MKNLGYMNGWGSKVPAEVELCKLKGHKRDKKEVGRCVNEYSCKICEYKYKIDSSD
jgi:hypothetical protein